MKKFHKLVLIFSLVYWFIIACGMILTGLSFSKVPIGYYGLKLAYFSSQVDPQYYTNGHYNKGIASYFVLYPRTKQCITNQQLSLTNRDLQRLQVTYSLCYRINPNGLVAMYNQVGQEYENRLKAIVNNAIGNGFGAISQQESRVNTQDRILTEWNSNGRQKVITAFKGGLQVQAIWVNKIRFIDQTEQYYQTAYIYSSSSSASYETAAYNLSMAKIQLNSINSAIQSTKDSFIKKMQVQAQLQYNSLISQALSFHQEQIASISNAYGTSRILNYYKPASFQFF